MTMQIGYCGRCGSLPRLHPQYGGFAWACDCPAAPTITTDNTMPVYTVSEHEFAGLKRAITHPVKPTESIKRGAEQIRRLYGK